MENLKSKKKMAQTSIASSGIQLIQRHGLSDGDVGVGAIDGGEATRHEELLHRAAVLHGQNARLQLSDGLLVACFGDGIMNGSDSTTKESD